MSFLIKQDNQYLRTLYQELNGISVIVKLKVISVIYFKNLAIIKKMIQYISVCRFK